MAPLIIKGVHHIFRVGLYWFNNRRTAFQMLVISGLVLLFTACPEKNNPPHIADCDPGYHPCETDSTECCLDTTSHNFVWEIDTLGDYGSYLNDVAIIDENNIWVVGYIKDGDSTYNAAHWEGNEWELNRLPAITYSGSISQGALTSIYAIGADEIWCSSDAGSYVRWNGQEWLSEWIPDRNGGINAVWGTSSSDMYFVGDNGSIVHYDGSGFEKMESLPGEGGTDIDFKDIWGVVDEKTGKVDIWVCGDDNNPDRSIVLTLDNGTWKTVYERYPYGGGTSIDDEIYITPKTCTL
jgi:hypothetical protein